ncbi:MAG: hypothetical protein WD690_07910 [Vicinamibacterales bacterium]
MRDRFSLRQRRLPRTEAFLASTASTESPDARVLEVPAGGYVYFPALPLTSTTQDVSAFGTTRFTVSDPGPIAFSGIIARAVTSDPPGAAGHMVDYEIRSTLLGRAEVGRLIARPDVEVLQAPLMLKFAYSGCTSTETPFLDSASSAVLQARAASTAKAVDLFIVDSGWPTAEAQKTSLARLYEIANAVRASYGMPSVAPVIPAFRSSGYDHAERIHRALEPLRAIDSPSPRVRITYVPLSLAQDSKAILHEFIMLSSVIALRGAFSGNASDKHITQAIADADGAVKRLPPVPGLIMPSDKVILDAINRVAARASDPLKTYYVANYSFTYEAGVVGYEPPAIPRGLGVVAAGNDNLNVNEKNIDLAHRSATDAHFITVMNIDRSGGRDCGSSFVADDVLDDAAVVGFTGSLGTESQTSFAAPRVAWLLALAEASNPSPIPVADTWFVRLRSRLRKARPAGQQPYASITLDPVKLASIFD